MKKEEIKKVVLAYSGGLDTSIIIPWLKENYDFEVIAVAADVGQGEELEPLKEKAIKAAARFLIQRGYEVLETGWESEGGSAIDVVAQEDDAIVFVDVYARRGSDKGMPEGGGEASRERREVGAATWLAEHDDEERVNLPIRFDSISMMVISDSRALLRHHINCLGEVTAGETD